MNNYEHIFGVDVSKKTLDITHAHQNKFTHQQFTNDEQGMKRLMSWLKQIDPCFQNTLFCMEATGLYCLYLTNFLAQNSIDIWIEHSPRIKQTNALARGKNDKIDSQRIAAYAIKNIDQIRLWKPMNETLEKIKHLATLRERIVETRKKLLIPIKEFEDMGNTKMAKLLTKSIKTSLAALEKDLKNIEASIVQILKEDENLNKLFKLITSVVGIGFVTAINLMVHTNGFTMLKDTRKLACYCGVAPFEYSSGSSVRGKTRVHYMANKKLKANLHMASLTAVKHDADIRAYYERKVAEGKNKMSVLNAVRNKLLARIVAVVKHQREYIIKAA